MSDHEFEKQVRQKLNNLKLPPSPETWERIEGRIRERKRRRVPLLWLSLVAGGLVTGGYWMNRTLNAPSSAPLVAAGSTSATPATVTHPDPAGRSATGTQSPTPAEQAVPNLPDQRAPGSPPAPVSSAATGAPHDHPSVHQTNAYRPSLPDKKYPAAAITASGLQKRIPSAPAAGDGPAPSAAEAGERLSGVGVANLAPADMVESAAASTPSKIPLHAVELPSEYIKMLPDPVFRAAAPANSKWSYAVTAYGGVTAVNDGGLFSFNHPSVEDVAYTANFQNASPAYAPPAPNVSPAYAPQPKPSTISPGVAFSAGMEVKRELGSRFSLSLGLTYAQFNTHSKVSQRVNSSQVVNNGPRGYLNVQSYYLLDPNENLEYKNRYHFIEVPLTLHTRINNSTHLPLYWNAGIVVSRLLSSTSLHFDGTTGVYYKNDRLLNQTQAGVTTGFSLALFNKTAHPLWIGPSARSNISTILKKDISASKHFVTLGLDVKMFLKR